MQQLQNHWWWRPGWRPGRHFYACHLTFDHASALHDLVDRYQDALRPFPGFDLIPRRWLHLTMQGIGFTDEVTDAELDSVAAAITMRLARTPAPVVSFHQPVIRPEAIYLPAQPAEPLATVRTQTRSAIADALGPGRVPEQREQLAGFRPHVSLAYSNRDQPAEPIAKALGAVAVEPVTMPITHASLLVFHRDRRMYEWTHEQPIPIGRGRLDQRGTPNSPGRAT